jgi:serine/threonine-protein kinase
MTGQTFGSYRCIQQLGEGGMGIVYLAQHALLGRRVAVKVLRPEHTRNPEIVDRFFTEARATTLIHHPGLVDIFDFGHADGGSVYIVMELLEGESLAARLKRERTLAIPQAIEIARQVAQALGAVHARGIVHRDLKPDNVFLLADDKMPQGIRAKVIDFGVAKLLEGGAFHRTRTGAIIGTPVYMPPEQCRGDQVNHRNDIYSLGCMLFEMICGRPPYVAKGAGDLIAMHLFEPVPPLPDFVPAVLAASIRRALAKNADDRQQSMAELATELEDPAAAAARRAEAPTMLMPAVAPEPAATIVDPPPAPPSRHAARVVLIALVAAGALAAALAAWLH